MLRKTLCCVVPCLAVAVVTAAAQTEKMTATVTRLLAEAPAVLPEQSRAGVVSRLERSRAALAAGRVYLALYDLQPGYEAVAGYRLAATEQQVADHAGFTRRWNELGPPPAPPAGKADVMFVEALAQSAEGRAPATYRASLPYAQDAGLQAGLYYLGESHAMVDFAALCRSLALPAAGRRPAIGPIEPALAAYEAEVVQAYDAATAAQRPQYAGVNVAIKLARTLNEQGRHEGALLQYLTSRYRYRLITAAEGASRPAGELATRIRSVPVRAGVDHSIARFFLELAAATADGPAPGPQAAAAILDDILPAYSAVVKP
jgi:hypothetical protein